MADDPHINIRIGASKDASTGRVLRDIRSDYSRFGRDVGNVSKQAFAEAARAAKRAQRELENEGRSRITSAQRDARTLINLERSLGRARLAVNERVRRSDEARAKGQHVHASRERVLAERNAQVAMKVEDRVAAHRARVRRREAEDQRLGFERVARREDVAHRRQQNRMMSRRRRAASIASYTVGNAFGQFAPGVPSIGMMGRFAMDLARGVGIETSPAALLGNAVTQESENIQLSSQGIIPTDPANRLRVDPEVFRREARRVGDLTGTDMAEVRQGLIQFQKITGDTSLGLDLLEDMAKLNVGSSTSQSEGFAAAANIAQQLGDMPAAQKRAKVLDVVRAFIGQGKTGAVEFSDLARYAPALVGSARFFEGDIGDTMKTFGVIAQASREAGGSNNAAMAARSVSRLATTLKKPARVKAFKALGVDPFDDLGRIRDPIQIIRESMVAGRNDPRDWHSMFAELIGERAASGLSDPFRMARNRALEMGESDTDATKKGLEAFDRHVRNMLAQTLTMEQVNENLAFHMGSTAATTAKLNNMLTDTAANSLGDFKTALEEAAPSLEILVRKLSGITTMAIRNPGTAVGIAAGGVLATSAAGTGMRIAMEAAIMAIPWARVGGLMAAGFSTALIAGGAALAGAALFEHFNESQNKEVKRMMAEDPSLTQGEAAVKYSQLPWMNKIGLMMGEAKPHWWGAFESQPGAPKIDRMAASNELFSNSMFGTLPDMLGLRTPETAVSRFDRSGGKESEMSMSELSQAMQRLTASIDKGLKVNVDLNGIPGGMMPGQKSSMAGGP